LTNNKQKQFKEKNIISIMEPKKKTYQRKKAKKSKAYIRAKKALSRLRSRN